MIKVCTLMNNDWDANEAFRSLCDGGYEIFAIVPVGHGTHSGSVKTFWTDKKLPDAVQVAAAASELRTIGS